MESPHNSGVVMKILCLAWSCMPLILALGKMKQKGHKFKARLIYVVKPVLYKFIHDWLFRNKN